MSFAIMMSKKVMPAHSTRINKYYTEEDLVQGSWEVLEYVETQEKAQNRLNFWVTMVQLRGWSERSKFEIKEV